MLDKDISVGGGLFEDVPEGLFDDGGFVRLVDPQ